jgi:hypothetical protein
MNYNAINDYLWSLVNSAGWWWWGPCAVAAAFNIFLLGNLAPAKTRLGKTLRYTSLLGYWLTILSPLANVGGAIAMPILMTSWVGIHWQMYQQCKSAATIPPARDRLGRLIDKLIKHNGTSL